MDLYGINPVLRKGYPDRTHFSRTEGPQAGSQNKISKFVNNDILSSSAWSSVIHQPSQDSEPEDLPSTVDIDAIKEPPTPVNASAQTPLGQLHGDSNSFALSDDQNVGDSGSDSDSDSDSGNSDNEVENAGSGADSGSFSDSDSVSSHRSSCSSRSKPSHSSRSNSPIYNDNSQKPFTLPKNCDLSEDSDDSDDSPLLTLENEAKKENNRTIGNLAQLTQLENNSDHLQVLNEDDLAAVLPDVKQPIRCASIVPDFSTNKLNTKSLAETKKIVAAFSDSSSDSEMLPKQVVREAINSIHIEPHSPPYSQPSLRSSLADSKSNMGVPNPKYLRSDPKKCENATRESSKSCKSSMKNLRNSWKVPPFFGNSTDDHISNVKSRTTSSSNLTMFQEKRGPGRPRKNDPYKMNGKISGEKQHTNKSAHHRFGESFEFPSNVKAIVSNSKPKKSKYVKSNSVVLCLENSRKSKKKKNMTATFVKMSSALIPVFPTRNDWIRRHKKRKKKDLKVKTYAPEILREIESLTELFNRKCTIEDKRLSVDSSFSHHPTITRSKVSQRNKDKNKKRKHSDKESEAETISTIPHVPSGDTKSKRRHKKSATETPKVQQTNCDQRLPLKKRHYHVSAPSAGANGSHQVHNGSKVRTEKHPSKETNDELNKANDDKLATKSHEISNLPPTLSSAKKEKPRKRTKDMDIDTPPVLDEYSKQPNLHDESALSGKSNASLAASVQSSKKPELITPLPTEPSSAVTSPGLKPPAGVFEPSRKLPPSLSKCKKTCIDDMLCKLKEKLKGLESPSKNTSALIEKIGANVSNEDTSTLKRVLRPKRTSTEKDKEKEKENICAKKNKGLKDVTIRLTKLPNEVASSPCGEEQEGMKPKIIKRRKMRNRTGFPIKKKKKKYTSAVAPKASENCAAVAVVSAEANSSLQDERESKVEQAALTVEEVKTVKEKVTDEEKKPIRLLRKREPPKDEAAEQTTKKKGKVEVKPKLDLKKKKAKKVLLEEEPSNGRSLRKREPPKESSAKEVIETKKKPEIKKKTNDVPVEKAEEDSMKDLKEDELSSDDSKKDVAPKKRSKVIPAGLFSDYYKEDKMVAKDPKNRHIPYKPEDHPQGLLPPPPYFDDWVRKRHVNFKLPYDLWWLHTYGELPARNAVESWKYRPLQKNMYNNDMKPPYVYEAQACNCKLPEEKDKLGCGEDCINRVLYAECSPDLCPLKERCSNQRIRKHEGYNKKLVKYLTKDKGKGVKTREPIKAGEYIVEYVGEVVTDKEFKNRMNSLYKNDIHHYCLNLDGGWLIDGHRSGSYARFVNHSCEPNCEIQKWNVDGRYRMGLFAQRDIEADEELTYDYNFALFNPEEGQPCRCGSSKCRGVIGGKSQRVSLGNSNTNGGDACTSSGASQGTTSSLSKNSRIRPRKQERKNANAKGSRRRDSDSSRVLPHRNKLHLIPLEPLTSEEKEIVRKYRVFLQRNLNKVRHVREKVTEEQGDSKNSKQNAAKNGKSKPSVEFMRQLNALTQHRIIKTRGLAQVEDDPEMNKTLQLANLFRTIYTFVVSVKDENSSDTFSSLFMSLPSKQKLPTYYQRIEEPIDLTTIEKNIVTGVYKDVEGFDKDMERLIANNVKYYGRLSEHGIAAVRLRKAYSMAKVDHIGQIEEITGQPIPNSFIPAKRNAGDEEEDVIRCICGLYNDEGLMIQCERCLVWQHCGCVKVVPDVEHYYCERCLLREVDYEIPLDVPLSEPKTQSNKTEEVSLVEEPELKDTTVACPPKELKSNSTVDACPPEESKPNKTHYLTLMRDDLQIKQGDTVYVLRDITNPETKEKHTFRTIKTFKYEDCDIFRVEELWKDEKGDRYVFGHHYLRPHETFHEPSRKFFPNEVLSVSLHEVISLNLIMGRCYVLDLRTYCKGRPMDADPEHIYICEFSVDKAAKTFRKLKKKSQYPVLTKSYAFEEYDTMLKPKRTYAPHKHEIPKTGSHVNTHFVSLKSKPVSNQKSRVCKPKEVVEPPRVIEPVIEASSSRMSLEDDFPLARLRDSKLQRQKRRLDSILLRLLTDVAKKSSTRKSPLNLSYLFDVGKRNRTSKMKAQQAATTNNT